MKSSRKNNFVIFLTLFVILCNVDFNLARPNGNRGSRKNKNREMKAKRNWSDSVAPVVVVNDDNVETFTDKLTAVQEEVLPVAETVPAKSEKPALHRWLELERVHAATISARMNSDLTLECTAVGSPPPSVYWLKDGQPLEIGGPYDRELNHVYDSHQSSTEFSMANVKSKIPLRCLRPKDQGTYTCVAQNEGRELVSQSFVFIDESMPAEQRAECEGKHSLLSFNKKGRKGQPAFVHSYEYLHMETMGNDVILTCSAGGKPKPAITWLDIDGKEITNGKKFWTNPTGNLVINNLSWKEMGEYTCRVQNEYGSDSGSTFLYPLLSETSS